MAKRKKRSSARKTKSNTSKRKTKTAKKMVKRVVNKKSRRTSKKVAVKTARPRTSGPKRVKPQIQRHVPVVEGEIIDVVDEPMPGVVRVTEIDATRVTVPGSDNDNDE